MSQVSIGYFGVKMPSNDEFSIAKYYELKKIQLIAAETYVNVFINDKFHVNADTLLASLEKLDEPFYLEGDGDNQYYHLIPNFVYSHGRSSYL